MKRILTYIFSILLLTLAGIHPIYAQADSIKKQIPANAKIADSEKNQILSRQTDEFQSVKADQMGDSIRLLQLKYELLKLGANDSEKKQSIATEREQIIIRDSLRKVLQRLKIDSLRSIYSGYPVVLSDDTLFNELAVTCQKNEHKQSPAESVNWRRIIISKRIHWWSSLLN
jgi:hypothetical protein